MCTAKQISAGVDACLAMMDGEFCLQTLQSNDPNYDWEFVCVETLAEEHGITGLYCLTHGILATVYFQSGMTEEETLLTIAHELGHHWLHRNSQIGERMIVELGLGEDVAGRSVENDARREWEAETFGKLLMERCGTRELAYSY